MNGGLGTCEQIIGFITVDVYYIMIFSARLHILLVAVLKHYIYLQALK
jgi:hypothetical protein